jgi:hypothetical protein
MVLDLVTLKHFLLLFNKGMPLILVSLEQNLTGLVVKTGHLKGSL